jgi:DNA-binding transcriptional MocR family regulator
VTDTIWCPDLSQSGGPKYLALTRALREAIRDGTLPANAQLPTVRDLAWAMKVTPGTVSRAYQLATQEGLLAATVGRGTFVASQTPRLGPQNSMFQDREGTALEGPVDLRPPLLPDVGQSAAFAAAMRDVGGREDIDWLDYTTQRGELPLRRAVCDWVAERDLGDYGPEDVALTNGGQNAVLCIFLCCLRGDRPVVLVEDLAFSGFRHAARLARAEVVGVELDDQGMVPQALEAACLRHRPQVLCLTPDAQNPTTARMGAARRAEIIAIARKHDLQVIEDACYSTADDAMVTMRALAPERVWHVGSLSKSITAALRFGYIICPAGMGEAGRLTAQHSFFALSRSLSEVVLHLMETGVAQELRARVLEEVAERTRLFVSLLGTQSLAWQDGLPFLWPTLPSGWWASTYARMAEGQGVLVRMADEFSLNSGRAPNAVRIAIAGNMPRARLEGAMAVLRRLLDSPPYDVAV